MGSDHPTRSRVQTFPDAPLYESSLTSEPAGCYRCDHVTVAGTVKSPNCPGQPGKAVPPQFPHWVNHFQIATWSFMNLVQQQHCMYDLREPLQFCSRLGPQAVCLYWLVHELTWQVDDIGVHSSPDPCDSVSDFLTQYILACVHTTDLLVILVDNGSVIPYIHQPSPRAQRGS